jgi:hypothetical protein
MLREVTSEELSEWIAYYNLKDWINESARKQQEASDKAKKQGR